jgi:diguanylate cyclase (GGDEF)-like protein
MQIDVHTLSIVYFAVALSNGVMIMVVAWLWRGTPGVTWWFAGNLAIAAMAGHFYLAGHHHATLVAGTVYGTASFVLTHQGLLLFFGERAGRITVPVVATLGVGSSVLLYWLGAGDVVRAVLFQATFAYVCVRMIMLLVVDRGPMTFSCRLLAGVFAAGMVMVLARLPTFLMAENPSDVLATGGANALAYIGATVLSTGRTVGLILMMAQRLQGDVERYAQLMAEAALIDPLTGIANRRRAIDHGRQLFAAWRRYGRRFAVIALDIDHFKRINDSHGHAIGDEVLREVASRLTATVRELDLVARLGGEEFSVLLPEADLPEAAALGERLRTVLADLAVLGLPGAQPVTASFGVAAIDDADDTFEAVLRRADTALYRAKAAGRDRVETDAAAARAAVG